MSNLIISFFVGAVIGYGALKRHWWMLICGCVLLAMHFAGLFGLWNY